MENITDEKYIGLICNGEFNAIPDFKIGELFESFFDNINYNVIKEDKVFVDFTGEAFCDGEPCTILIRFEIDSNVEEFEIVTVKVNNEELNETEVLDLLEDIAYVGGAAMENDYCSSCCSEDCSHCGYTEEDEFDDEEESDDYDDEYDDDEEDEDPEEDEDE